MDAREQVGETLTPSVAAIVLVAVHCLAEERDLLAALGGQLADLSRNMLRRPALFGPAHLRHDAVGAELVAADHDPHIGLERRRPHGGIAQGIVTFKAALD